MVFYQELVLLTSKTSPFFTCFFLTLFPAPSFSIPFHTEPD
ncbi:hypothetical protein BLGI_172 [Brevibacillus laterosporus GI-9]|nr:hypothetical protein BLGI_172 [Brevibacillus laterosporus GI-9]